ncbi:MAG: MFS transporter [Desulfobacteraceae bacterium]|nr:MFS transporter [Desulfobacteraceae bacterium]
MYPFAPAMARGLGVELSSITSIIALNQASSLFAPFIVTIGDRIGYKLLLLFSMALLTTAMFAVGLFPFYIVVMISLMLAGVSKSIIDPTLQGIAGNIVPIEKRGMVIGIMEFSWAASTLVGIPLSGFIIEKYNWQTPFLIIGCLTLSCFFIILKIFPRDTKIPNALSKIKAKKNNPPSTIGIWKKIVRQPKVKAMLVFTFFMCLANDNLFVVYGIWLESSYNLSLVVLGAGAFFIGLAEFLGESLTAGLSDRIGLVKSIVYGTLLTAISYFALIFLDVGLVYVLFGLFILFLTFEFTIVTSMSLSTELVPDFRASTMSLYFAVAGIGRVVGALMGGLVWKAYGIAGVGFLSGVSTLIALLAAIALSFRFSRVGNKKINQKKLINDQL